MSTASTAVTPAPASSPAAVPAAAVAPISQRILIVEDLEDTRASYQQLLQLALGLEVDTATDGEEGLRMLEERPYSLVITDLRMPKVSGLKLIEEVQARKLPSTIIVTT